MAGHAPLHAVWTLSGQTAASAASPGFTLPGADALSAFADLLGDAPQPQNDVPQPQGVPFALPAMTEQEVGAQMELSCVIDFSTLCADDARLIFEHIVGSGEALLDGERLACFDNGPLTLDLTHALRLCKKQTLTLRFESSGPIGVPGNVLLHTGNGASIGDAFLLPCTDGERMTLRCAVHARQSGRYRLIAQPCTCDAGREAQPARELTAELKKDETRTLEMTLCVPADRFLPLKPYTPAALKLLLVKERPRRFGERPPRPRLFARMRHGAPARPPEPAPLSGGTLCDCLTLMCGYPGTPARAYVPLTEEEALLSHEALIRRAQALCLPALAVESAASEALARALTLAGISLVLLPPVSDQDRLLLSRLPAVSIADRALCTPQTLEHSALQLASMVLLPRRIAGDASPAALLREASGRDLNPDAPDVRERLVWLRAVSVRLNAEAARQGKLQGAICAPGEWTCPDIREALRTAFAPMHVSALPQRGAWWTLSCFSASVHAFVPESFADKEPLLVHVSLEDEAGIPLAASDYPCALRGSELGVFEAALPGKPCVLTLSCRLLCGDAVLEENELPIYVGLRGALEAAFC